MLTMADARRRLRVLHREVAEILRQYPDLRGADARYGVHPAKADGRPPKSMARSAAYNMGPAGAGAADAGRLRASPE
jgi:hypothetical protein